MSKIALVIGHTPSSPGAVGSLKISEYVFNNELVQEILKHNGLDKGNEYKVFYRNPRLGYTFQMIELHEDIDAWGADVSIELHFNGSNNPEVNGHEVLYTSKGGQEVAEAFDKQFDALLPNRDRNVKKVGLEDRGGGFICRGKSKAVILEPFFSSHQHLYVKDGEERANLVQAIVNTLSNL